MATRLNRGGLTPKSERTAYETNKTLRGARLIDSALKAISTVNADRTDRTEELGNTSDHSLRANGQAA